jgi:hypothetical protein
MDTQPRQMARPRKRAHLLLFDEAAELAGVDKYQVEVVDPGERFYIRISWLVPYSTGAGHLA